MAKKAIVTGNGGRLIHFFDRGEVVTFLHERKAVDDGVTPIFEFESEDGMRQGMLRQHFEWVDGVEPDAPEEDARHVEFSELLRRIIEGGQ